jgi:hypothetical protein
MQQAILASIKLQCAVNGVVEHRPVIKPVSRAISSSVKNPWWTL